MVNSSAIHHEDEEFHDGDIVSRNASSSNKMKEDGTSGEQKSSTLRSKHSETEQRRRSKINERFQKLRDIIPPNDQKRDKASLLWEVIEYIKFLQDKINLYEGSYQEWSREPAKLIPWRKHGGRGETFMDHSHVMINGSGGDGSVLPSNMITNTQRSLESDLGRAIMDKGMDHAAGLATRSLPFDVQVQPNIFASVERSGVVVANSPFQDSICDSGNIGAHAHSQLWESRPCTAEYAVANSTINEPELKADSGSDSGFDSISNAYSQGVLNTLTQVLQSSGVDLSQASISVQLDVGKRANNGQTSMASFNSKDRRNPALGNELMAQSSLEICGEDFDQVYKKPRTNKS